MLKYITHHDIARLTKLHQTTVSRALRNHPDIAPKTRLQVQKAAKKLGYIPDPMLSSLAAHRESARRVTFHETLAWVVNGPTPDWWFTAGIFRDFYDGARVRALELGYKLEPFWLRESGMNLQRAASVLKARNISGLLLAPQFRTCDRLKLDWSDFSAVTIGYTLISPQLHMVAPNQFRAAKILFSKLKHLGYQRIGLVAGARQDQRVQQGWSGGYLTEQIRLHPDNPMLPFLAREQSLREIEASFWRWFERFQPQVIMTPSATDVWNFLKKRGLRVPDDVGVAYLNLQPEMQSNDDIAGIFEMPLEVGAAAVELLIGMLQHDEKGIPKSPKRVLIEGVWKDGGSVRNLLA